MEGNKLTGKFGKGSHVVEVDADGRLKHVSHPHFCIKRHNGKMITFCAACLIINILFAQNHPLFVFQTIQAGAVTYIRYSERQ